MARTTLDIDPMILGELRRRGREEKKSMGQLASELLARALSTPPDEAAGRRFHWTSRDLGTPTVDLEDKEALRRVLDTSP